MKTNVLRKIALILVIAMVIGCFSGCKTPSKNEALKQVIDIEGVAGDEIVIEIPEASENEDAEDEDNDANEPAGEENEGAGEENETEEPGEENNTEGSGEENTEGSGEEEEEGNTVEKPAYDPNKAFKIISYNIKCAWYGDTIDQVAQQLKEEDADIVGLQEVDCGTGRSKKEDQVKKIAELAGYPYYVFEPVIEIGTGAPKNAKAPADLRENAYGHAILSKYPIKKSEIIWPTAQVKSAENEVRNFGRHEIDVNGKTVVFYNCHLDFALGREQYFEIQEQYMSKDKYAVCVGDFNETYDEFKIYFDNDKFYNFSFGDDGQSPVLRTNKETGKTSQVIDHIIVSRDTFVWKDDEVKNGYYFRWHDGASDHQMIYAYVNLLD